MEAKIYNQEGKESGSISLPEKVFAAKWRPDLVHQVVMSMKSNRRAGTANAKGRGEVSGGGKKPWRQKGTGRARHGSIRSPIWVGGGVTHGPLSEKNYNRKISKKMRAEALFSALSKKFREGEVVFIDSLALPAIKAKEAAKVLKNLSKIPGIGPIYSSKKKKTLLSLYEGDEKTKKSFRNLPQLEVSLLKNLNPAEVLDYKYILIEKPAESLEFLASKGK